jgi:integrase
MRLLALTWANLDLDVGTARIRRSLGLVGNALTWKAPKSEAGERTVELPTFALAALRAHRRRQAELHLAFGDAYDAEADLVIAMPDGRPVRPDYASAAFRALVKRAGLPAGIHPHTMRHAVASLFLADDGEPATVIASQLGHRDGGALAQRTYIHALPEAAARVAGRLDETLGAKPERIRRQGRRMVENTVYPTPRTIAACTGHAAFRLVAEADGNRTRLSRVAAHTGFED